MIRDKARASAPKLVSRATLFGLGCVTLLGWYGLMPLAHERQTHAQSTVPSALSLRFLELGVASRPQDAPLRLRLAQQQREAGQLEAARDTVRLLQHGHASDAATLLLLEIEHARWSAVDPADGAREKVRAELRASLDAVDPGLVGDVTLARCAALYRELEQPGDAARLLDAQARRAQTDTEQKLSLAESAWLEVGLPLKAAELLALFASRGGTNGPAYALRALDRARTAQDPQAATTLLLRMRALYPRDAALLRLAIQLAEAQDAERAFQLAQELSGIDPANPEFRRELARLAEATGRSLRALDEYVWLWRHGHRAEDRERALDLARANWDLQIVRELLEHKSARRPARARKPRRCQASGTRVKGRTLQPRAELRERLEVYEALGDAAAAHQLLVDATATYAAYDEPLWQKRLEIELYSSERAAALRTLSLMCERFPSPKWRERLVDLQLALGQTRAALASWLMTPSAMRDQRWLRQTVQLAAAAGDITAERRAYEELVREPDATLWDWQRLLQLAPDRASALRAATAAAEHFESFEMVYVALQLYRATGDEAGQAALLARAEPWTKVARRSDYWQTRITLHQTLAARAATSGDYVAAKRGLDTARSLLENATRKAPAPAIYSPLRDAQCVQELSVGLGSDDRELIARAYAEYRAKLSPRQRVFILSTLHRSPQALNEARSALARADLDDSDREVLQSDALNLSRGRARSAEALADVVSMQGLSALHSHARVDYAEVAGGVRAEASYTLFRSTADPASAVIGSEVREVAGQLRGRLDVLMLELGLGTRDGANPRPFGGLGLQLAGDEERGAGVQVLANVATTDTARLRALAVRDAITIHAAVGFGPNLWFSARGAAEVFFTRQERALLGSGLTLDSAVGSKIGLPAALGDAGLRLFTRLAPRLPLPARSLPQHLPVTSWLPATSEWVGIGASLGRGQLDAPPPFGRRFAYLLDAGVGWLWPASGIGYATQARLGVSVLGADLISIGASTSNVIGSTTWSASLGYALTFDR